MLAGTGSGSTAFRISPINEIKRMIKNCFKYFKTKHFLTFIRYYDKVIFFDILTQSMPFGKKKSSYIETFYWDIDRKFCIL